MQTNLPQCLDGVWADDNIARIPVATVAATRGVGVFNVTRTYKGQAFEIDAVVTALLAMAKQSHIDTKVTKQEIIDWVNQGLAVVAISHPGQEVNIRIKVLGGRGQSLDKAHEAHVVILFDLIGETPKAITLKTHPSQRAYPHIKHINYFEAYVARQQALQAGYDDILYVDSQSRVLEASKNNIIFVEGDTVYMPNHDIYFGLARDILCRQVDSSHLVLKQQPVAVSQLKNIDAAYVTGLTHGLVPVAQIDGQVFASANSIIHKTLRNLYDDYVDNSFKG